MSDTSVRIMCPSLVCRKVLSVPGEARGKAVRCKSCGTVIRIPDKSAAAPPPRPAEGASKDRVA